MTLLQMLGRSSVGLVLIFGMSLRAEETTTEKIEATSNKAGDSMKGATGDLKDKACQMINGKLECTVKKMKNKAKNLSDRAATKAKELKNKVD